ncbi:MAG: hypothetical protein HY428_02330 [Candidatus Levybacteria bacterium]|nr:hypothetical protein [Candidatus Levybacteria bacterium]
MTNDNDIEKLLIVDSDDYSKDKAREIAARVIKFAKISKTGDIILIDTSLSPDDKIRLALVLRFIAHIFNNEIPETITLKELTVVLSERMEAVGSRLSQIIKNENFAKKVKKGEYLVHNFTIDRFLTNLENKDANTSPTRQGNRKKSRKSSAVTKKTVTGVGKEILELLVNNDFFKTPRTIKEVCDKLKQETKYYDVRVVDATIRKTFVANQRILRRLPAEGKSKARWVYVNAK